MFDRLMRWAVFAQANRIMRKHMDHTLLHQRCHPQRVTRVIREGQEGAAKRQITTMQRHPIHDGCHTELTHAIVNVATELNPLRGRAHRYRSFPVREVRTGQIS